MASEARVGSYAGEPGDPDRGENPAQRIDRNFDELLQETRVIQTGIQVLFAFLLIVPFQARFPDLTAFQRWVYIVVLFLVALSTVCALGPVVGHRVLFQRRVKGRLLRAAHRMAEASLALLGIALIGGVALVVDMVLGPIATAVAAAVLTAVVIGTWIWVPTRILRHAPDEVDL